MKFIFFIKDCILYILENEDIKWDWFSEKYIFYFKKKTEKKVKGINCKGIWDFDDFSGLCGVFFLMFWFTPFLIYVLMLLSNILLGFCEKELNTTAELRYGFNHDICFIIYIILGCLLLFRGFIYPYIYRKGVLENDNCGTM